jgi:ABC-type transport system substrate-binding protein
MSILSTPYPGITPMVVPTDFDTSFASNAPTSEPQQETDYVPLEFDALIQEFKKTTNPEKRKEIVNQLKSVPKYLQMLS